MLSFLEHAYAPYGEDISSSVKSSYSPRSSNTDDSPLSSPLVTFRKRDVPGGQEERRDGSTPCDSQA